MHGIDMNAYLKICNVKRTTYDVRLQRGEVGYAFGLGRRLAGGTLLDLDCICHAVTDALAPLLSRKHAATVVRTHTDKILEAVGLADDDPAEIIYLAALEFGPGFTITPAHKMMFAVTTLANLAKSAAKSPEASKVTRTTLINVTKILADVRISAAKIGLDFSAPFFPPPTDPRAAKWIATAKKDRDRVLQMIAEENLEARP